MAELEAALNDTLARHGRLVMLAGEPGIGKTRTARELASNAEQHGAVVLWGRCYEEEGTPAYWPWVQTIRSYVQKNDSENALNAYRLLRGAFYSVRSFYTPGKFWILRCNEKIAVLMAKQPATSESEKTKTYEERLGTRPGWSGV